MFKKLTLIFTAAVLSLSLFVPTYASELGSTAPTTSKIEIINNGDDIAPAFVNDFRFRKKNVQKYNSWSGFSKVSSTLTTKDESAKLGVSIKKTYGVSITGAISGLNINTSVTLSTDTTCEFDVKPYRSVYIGHRVLYAVEKGTRECYDVTNGKVVSSNAYTVKTPIDDEYRLINI